MLTHAQLAELAAAAQNGGLLMDEKKPGWAARVNPDTLNIRDMNHCVVGQSMRGFRYFGVSYVDKLRRLGITLQDTPRYGFAVWLHNHPEAWDALADAWRQEIADRTTPTTTGTVEVEEPLALAV